mmetsp:Transcript_10724/g.15687  ORF Transcript_10724/g.15687 Transcript_10724/m.15687 type:complete len:320 (+) Transcript_10724:65-1024(+)
MFQSFREETKKEDDTVGEYDDVNLVIDLSNFSAETRLLEKRKEMLDMQSALETKRKEYESKLNSLQSREQHIADERNKLTDNIVELDKFIRENEMRKERAEQKQRIEEKARKTAETKIAQLENMIEDMEQSLQSKKRLLAEKYSKYHRYLQKVVYQTRGQDNPDEVELLMKRFDSLKGHNRELTRDFENLRNRVNAEEKHLIHFKDSKNAEVINFNKDIAHLKRSLESTTQSQKHTQKRVEEKIGKLNRDQVISGQVYRACEALFERTTTVSNTFKRNRFEGSGPPPIEKQLNVIKNLFSDFSEIKRLIDLRESNDFTM